MSRQCAIRFVGGIWHNRVELVELRPVLKVPVPLDLSKAMLLGPTGWSIEYYSLTKFYTEYRTLYYQYVHGSLIKDGVAVPCTYLESFTPWNLDKRKINRQLARAMHEHD